MTTPTAAQRRILDTLKAGGVVLLDLDTCGADLYTASGRTVGSCKESTLRNCMSGGWIVEDYSDSESDYQLAEVA